MSVPIQVVFDCSDPDRLARFWAEILGYDLQPPPPGYETWEDFLRAIGVPEEEWGRASAIVDPEGKGPRVYFQRVPEGKVAKNRVHLDVNAGGGPGVALDERHRRVDAKTDRALALGATKLYTTDDHGEYCVTLQDVEGNEFCVQ